MNTVLIQYHLIIGYKLLLVLDKTNNLSNTSTPFEKALA